MQHAAPGHVRHDCGTISAYDCLYAFERVTKIYRDAARNPRRVGLPSIEERATRRRKISGYVNRIEQILAEERGQWGRWQRKP